MFSNFQRSILMINIYKHCIFFSFHMKIVYQLAITIYLLFIF